MPYKRSEDEFVSAVMSANLLTASAGDALTEAARRMAERRVGAILVTDGTGLTGIMTERDVLRAVGKASIDGTVGDWMTPTTRTRRRKTATIGQAAAMMLHGGYRHVPIVGRRPPWSGSSRSATFCASPARRPAASRFISPRRQLTSRRVASAVPRRRRGRPSMPAAPRRPRRGRAGGRS